VAVLKELANAPDTGEGRTGPDDNGDANTSQILGAVLRTRAG